ncbi:MAG: DNA-binding protein, partial [Longispora sp.]|nr:DNA-binding protein [Longispora sp. (in: high G+C Gram-positive bacteria)]
WRVERAEVEKYIERMYLETARWIDENPLNAEIAE